LPEDLRQKRGKTVNLSPPSFHSVLRNGGLVLFKIRSILGTSINGPSNSCIGFVIAQPCGQLSEFPDWDVSPADLYEYRFFLQNTIDDRKVFLPASAFHGTRFIWQAALLATLTYQVNFFLI
jgi:hypothetical protein